MFWTLDYRTLGNEPITPKQKTHYVPPGGLMTLFKNWAITGLSIITVQINEIKNGNVRNEKMHVCACELDIIFGQEIHQPITNYHVNQNTRRGYF